MQALFTPVSDLSVCQLAVHHDFMLKQLTLPNSLLIGGDNRLRWCVFNGVLEAMLNKVKIPLLIFMHSA